jgi:tetratricopeptide (TPR) repeat protein
MAETDNGKPNELLQHERERRGWSREYVAEKIRTFGHRMVARWEREGVIPSPRYRQRLCALFERSARELGFVKKQVPPYWNVPFPRNPFFTGREDMLEDLHERFRTPKTAGWTKIYSINGLAGIGKTQVALEYAYRYAHEYQSVLWARAESREVLISDFAAIAVLLHLEKEKEDQDSVPAVKRWLDALTRWLLILDNAADPQILHDFLPLMPRGHVLLTTLTQFTGTIAQGIELGELGLEHGALFLLRRAKILLPYGTVEQASADDYEKAKEITRVMGGLPLALDQAGAYIEETKCGLSEYLEFYQAQRITLLKERGNKANNHPKAVVATFLLSFEKVQQANSLAAELLRFCTFLYPDAIPEEIITNGASEAGPFLQAFVHNKRELNVAIRELLKYSLVHRNPSMKMLSMHRLVQTVIQDGLDEETKKQWAERVVRAVNRIFPEVEVTTWPQCERCLPQAQVCLELIARYQLAFPEAARLLNMTGRYLRQRGRFDEARPFLSQSFTMREQLLGAEHADTAASLSDLAELFQVQGKYDEAEPLFRLALAIRQKILGTEHLDTAMSMNDLAVLYADQGKYEQAEDLLQDALAIKERVLGAEHHEIAVSLCNLAALYHVQGKFNLAEASYQRGLAIFEKVLASEHPDTAICLDNLAGLYIDQGKYEQAESLSRRALTIKEKLLGPEHPDVSQSLITLALIYQAQGKYEQAESLFQRSLAIYEQTLGRQHDYTAGSLTYLAMLYTQQGKYEQAEPLSRRALVIKESILGPEHSSTATSLNNLAEIYLAQKKYEETEELCLRALAIREKALGLQHLDTAASLATLSNLYVAMGKYKDAEQLCQRVLAIREQLLGPKHLEVAKSLESLADILQKLGRGSEAEKHIARARAIRSLKQA